MSPDSIHHQRHPESNPQKHSDTRSDTRQGDFDLLPPSRTAKPLMTPRTILAFQRVVGNQAVQRLINAAKSDAGKEAPPQITSHPATPSLQRDIDPKDYGFIIPNPGRNDLVIRALTTVMESARYREMATNMRAEGPITFQLVPDLPIEARWHAPTRTIQYREAPRMELAGRFAFELANAAQNVGFQRLVTDVEQGRLTDPEHFAIEVERIEYASARRRFLASLETPGWNYHVDPTGRHFVPAGTPWPPHGRPQRPGTGLWINFDGFLDTQREVGHFGRAMERFRVIADAGAYLRNLAAQRRQEDEARIEAARQRYLERKKKRDDDPKGGN